MNIIKSMVQSYAVGFAWFVLSVLSVMIGESIGNDTLFLGGWISALASMCVACMYEGADHPPEFSYHGNQWGGRRTMVAGGYKDPNEPIHDGILVGFGVSFGYWVFWVVTEYWLNIVDLTAIWYIGVVLLFSFARGFINSAANLPNRF